jgi:ATP-dependent Clp protease ATP-binding subunit ClpA
MLRVRRRVKLARAFEPAPVVAELFVVAQHEAAALRHDAIGTEHMLLALISRMDKTARTLQGLGLELAVVRDDIRHLVGEGPPEEAAFDAEALGAIGVDLEAVRRRIEETFGEGALERASRRRGSCAGAAFGVAPQLKHALERAHQLAAQRNAPLGTADVALGLAHHGGSIAGRILDARAISPERLRAALGGSLDALG